MNLREILAELTFHGSQCTKDCSGHKAGYKWSLDRGGVNNPSSPSQSFINGSNIAVSKLKARKQGGGKIAGYQSQTPSAIRKRQQRAAKKAQVLKESKNKTALVLLNKQDKKIADKIRDYLLNNGFDQVDITNSDEYTHGYDLYVNLSTTKTNSYQLNNSLVSTIKI